MSWFAARVVPNRERLATEVVREMVRLYAPDWGSNDFVYLPQYRTRLRRICALFPGYIMVGSDLPFAWQSLVHYVSRKGDKVILEILQSGGRPSFVPQSDVERLRKMEDDEGILILPDAVIEKYRLGTPLQICSGQYHGCRGTYDGRVGNKIAVALEFAMGAARLLTSEADVAAVPA